MEQENRHSKRRIARYLSSLMSDNSASRTKVAKLLDYSTSRVTLWLEADRGMEARTAFEIGDLLRKAGWRTSGVEFLWTAGYFADVVNVVRYLAVDRDYGTDQAVALYSWLPQRLIQFEIDEITARLRDKFDIVVPSEMFDTTDVYHARRIGWDFSESDAMQGLAISESGAAEAGRYFAQAPFVPSAAHRDLDDYCGSNEFQERVRGAWSRYNSGCLDSPLKTFLATPDEFAVFELHVVDAIIDACRRLNDNIFPSYVFPKLWRLLAGWLYEVAESAPSLGFTALPRNFLTTSEAEANRSIIDETINGRGEPSL